MGQTVSPSPCREKCHRQRYSVDGARDYVQSQRRRHSQCQPKRPGKKSASTPPIQMPSYHFSNVRCSWVIPPRPKSLTLITIERKFESLDPEDMPIKTQLRLDASRRRIAEFYANVVIRFVLQDLATLMSKHMKRANEWITA